MALTNNEHRIHAGVCVRTFCKYRWRLRVGTAWEVLSRRESQITNPCCDGIDHHALPHLCCIGLFNAQSKCYAGPRVLPSRNVDSVLRREWFFQRTVYELCRGGSNNLTQREHLYHRGYGGHSRNSYCLRKDLQ
ncbi:hypothetical protein SUGI_1004590 [Cryptomeria japonica]|nr:hypothetical protein SUGI_1004590 [Cryptomeria japonica]